MRRASNPLHSAEMRSVAIFLIVLLPQCLLGLEQPENSSALSQIQSTTQNTSAGAAQVGAGVAAPQEPEAEGVKLETPQRAQDFKFTKVDLELLRQVDAFDKYMEEKGWVYNDPESDAYVQKLGLSLAPKETPENVTWHFRTLRDLEVNAFALPNGSIYVNTGLVSRMENEAQLAGVLAHEITHVTNRHGYLEYRSMRKKMVAIDIIQAATVAVPYGAAIGSLLPLLVVSTIFGYSRELEHEADVYAVNTLYLQKYDLQEFSKGFALLRKGPEVDLSKEPVFWANHPKLDDRVQYVSTMAKQLQPQPLGLRTGEPDYRASTKRVIRHNAGLALTLGKPRTAVAIAQRLMAEEPGNAENLVLLGDAYRTLGARTPVPEDEEMTEQSKNETRKMLRKLTIPEYDKALMAESHGTERWEANTVRSEEAFHKALAMDPANATAHRGLGFLAEGKNQPTVAIEEFKKYLELMPSAKDGRQIRMHIESLEKQTSVHLENPPAPHEEKK